MRCCLNIQTRFADLATSYIALQDSLKNGTSAENFARVKTEVAALQKQLQGTLIDSDALKNSLKSIKASSEVVKKQNVLFSQILNYEKANGKALTATNPFSGMKIGDELKQLKDAIPSSQDLGALDQLNNKFLIIKANVKAIGKEGNTFLTEIKNNASKFFKWIGMTLVYTKARMYISQLFTIVLDLDEAITDLKKTFNGTNKELNDFYYDANKLAKQLGVTTKEIIKMGSAWSRMGYNTKEAMETMAQMSAMFAAISPDLSTDEATNGLVSIMKAFDMDPENVLNGILSKINIIGNTAATSNGEIVEMLQKSASAMRESNNTLEQTIALETAAVEITRDASSVANAYKTIAARLRNLDEETLETIDDIEILTGKFAEATKTMNNPSGLSLFTDSSKQTFKSTYQIIKDLTTIWDELTDKQQAIIEELVGGKRQFNIVAASITNFEAAEKALDNMANSAGNAQAEMDVVRESAAYALNEMKETFTSLAQNAVSQNDLKRLIKLGTSLLEIVNGIVGGIGSIPTILGTIFGIMATKSKFLFSYNKDTNKFSLGGTELGKSWLGNWRANRAEIKATSNLINELKGSFDGVAISQNMMNKVSASSSITLKALINDFNSGKISSAEFTSGLNQLQSTLKTTNSVATTLKASIKSLGAAVANIAISMAISWAITSLINGVAKEIDEAAHKVENLTKSAKENADAAKETKAELESLNNELKTTKERLSELNRIKVGRNLSLVEKEEYETLQKYNDQLERQIKLETAKMEIELQKANNEAKEAIQASKEKLVYRPQTYKDQAYYFKERFGRDIGIKDDDIKDVSRSVIAKAKSEQELLLVFYEATQKKLKQMLDEQSKLTGKDFEKKTKK